MGTVFATGLVILFTVRFFVSLTLAQRLEPGGGSYLCRLGHGSLEVSLCLLGTAAGKQPRKASLS